MMRFCPTNHLSTRQVLYYIQSVFYWTNIHTAWYSERARPLDHHYIAQHGYDPPPLLEHKKYMTQRGNGVWPVVIHHLGGCYEGGEGGREGEWMHWMHWVIDVNVPGGARVVVEFACAVCR